MSHCDADPAHVPYDRYCKSDHENANDGPDVYLPIDRDDCHRYCVQEQALAFVGHDEETGLCTCLLEPWPHLEDEDGKAWPLPVIDYPVGPGTHYIPRGWGPPPKAPEVSMANCEGPRDEGHPNEAGIYHTVCCLPEMGSEQSCELVTLDHFRLGCADYNENGRAEVTYPLPAGVEAGAVMHARSWTGRQCNGTASAFGEDQITLLPEPGLLALLAGMALLLGLKAWSRRRRLQPRP